MSGDVLLAVGASRRVLKFATLADFAARLAVSFASAFSLVCFESSCQKFADDNKRPGVLRTQANIATEAIANRNTRDFTILLSSQKCRVGPIISHIEGGGYCSRVLFRRIPECETGMLGFRDSPERKPHPNDSQTLGRPFQSGTSSFEFGTRDTRAIISEGPTPEQAASQSGRPSRVGNSRTGRSSPRI